MTEINMLELKFDASIDPGFLAGSGYVKLLEDEEGLQQTPSRNKYSMLLISWVDRVVARDMEAEYTADRSHPKPDEMTPA
jgi:hypothetical protein